MRKILLAACAVFLVVSIIQAQETEEIKVEKPKKEKLLIKVKEDAKPDIYVDGKKFDFEVELLDQDKIESVNVIKGERAIKEYNAPNGVILIKTKKEIESDKSKIRFRNNEGEKDPMIIIDGKVSSKEALEKLSSDAIEQIDVLKGDKAIEKHNAPNGVIIVTTKKGKKGKK